MFNFVLIFIILSNHYLFWSSERDFMIGKCVFGVVFASVICAFISGNTGNLSSAILTGASDGINLVISLSGMICLWCGILEVLRESGAIGVLAKILSPLMRFAFPGVKEKDTKETVCAALSANILGIGNAATPLALKAMSMLDSENKSPECASGDMITFAVLGTAPFSLIPTTVITMLGMLGAASAFSVIVPVWISSLLSCIFAILLCRGMNSLRKGH